jgi:tetratricopeptide (TPR) repeat protein
MRPDLRTTDAAERAQFIAFAVRFIVPAFLIIAAGEFMAVARGWISPAILVVLLLLDGPVLFGVAKAIFSVLGRGAEAFSATVYGAGNLTPAPAHSGLESLAARGFYTEAAQAYREFLAIHPGDDLARIKLAELYRTHLGQPEVAERLYVEVRDRAVDPRQRFLAWNLLIELYRSTGRKDRLLVEVARFADRYRRTRPGRDAARLLRELKAELHGEQE